eukprot:4248113-Alexandrium_andersonii.AAC.1
MCIRDRRNRPPFPEVGGNGGERWLALRRGPQERRAHRPARGRGARTSGQPARRGGAGGGIRG